MRHHAFKEGDQIMIRVHLEWFPSGIVKKLQARGAGSFKILRRVGLNAYVVDSTPEYGISSTFNVVDLMAYKEPTAIPSDPFEPSPLIESEPTPEYPLAHSGVRRK